MRLELKQFETIKIMRVCRGIIFVVIVSYCTAQKICELPNSAEEEQEGVCVERNNCNAPPDPATLFTPRILPQESSRLSRWRCNFKEVCCPKDSVKTKQKTLIQLGCGYSNPEISINNINADYAAYGEFPWTVALMIKKDMPGKTFEDEYIGGGTIIHPSVVMTAAHKVSKVRPEELKCRAGEWNWSIEKKYKHQESDVKEIILHEEFNFVYVYYDVALLVLSSPFDLTHALHIGVGCLEPQLPMPGTVCYSMGWGKDIKNNFKTAVTLKKIKLSLINKDVCEKNLQTTKLGKRYKLHRTLICAGSEAGVDTCQGDGGSPLVCPIPDPERLRYSVVGIVGYGIDCGLANIPGVYVKVSQLYDWIVNKMIERNFNTTTFKYNIM